MQKKRLKYEWWNRTGKEKGASETGLARGSLRERRRMEEKKAVCLAIRRAGGAAGGMGQSLLVFGLDLPNPNQFHFYFKQGNPYLKKWKCSLKEVGGAQSGSA